MTMPISIPRATAALNVGDIFRRCAIGLGRLINQWVAATIARREREANLVVLRNLMDSELRDIGLNRCQIGEGLEEAAKERLLMQRLVRSRCQNAAEPKKARVTRSLVSADE
jgi:uncharacterized protein YjiS (DUF1127 family)